MHHPPHSPSVSVSDSTPLGILRPGGSCKNSAKPHWCWISDLCPFGFGMPERSYSSTAAGYRYAFNGKELDPVGMGGGGSTYDYGFRIYNAQIGKFLSVDPLTKSYPELTPYQFASNRPIDGIDLDGLEYYTIHVKISDGTGRTVIGVENHTNLTDAQIREIHKMSPKRFYKKFSKSFEKLGRGVLYKYYYYEDGILVDTEAYFDLQSKITRHGIYYGSGCITRAGDTGVEPKTEIDAHNFYDFSFDPIDEVDALAKQHDLDYATIPDYEGWFKDNRTLDADVDFVQGLDEYLKKTKDKNYIDSYTGRPPSKEAKSAAKNARTAFSIVAIKKWIFGDRNSDSVQPKSGDSGDSRKK